VTKAANGNLPHVAHQQIARLMQIHQQTHPKRLGARWNITDEYVRKIWSEMPAGEQAELEDVLGLLR
jgi:hypothetical protein